MLGVAVMWLTVGAAPTADSVGFIWHFPFVEQGDAEVAATGVRSMTCRAPWVRLEPEPGRFDFSPLQQQLDLARAGGFELILILECNPFCAPPWLREQVAAVGENVIGADGRPGSEPSTTSAVCNAARRRFLSRLVEFLQAADRQHTIVAYHPGIEWWFPPEFRHAPADVARFRAWLAARYGDIVALNARWRRDFDSFDAVEPPRITWPDLFRRGRVGLAELDLAAPFEGDLATASHDWFWFWAEVAAATLDQLADESERLDPTRATISFQTFAWAAAGEWDYLGWSAMPADEVARTARRLDATGLQLPLSWGDAHQVTVGLDLVRKYGKPLHALDLLDFTQGQAAGPEVMLRGTHAALAHGADAIDYCSWAGAGDYSFHPAWPTADLRRLVTEARRAMTQRGDLRPEPEAALVLPFTCPGAPNDPASFVGFYRLLQSLHVTVDLITPRELEAGAVDLACYEWVLVPDAPELPPAAVAALQSARLLLTTPRFAGAGLRRVVIDDLGHGLSYPLRRDSQAGAGPPMLDFRGEDPARRAELVAELRAALARAGCAPRIVGLPAEVSCTFLRGRSGWGLYLWNRGATPAPAATVTVAGVEPGEVRTWADLEPATVGINRPSPQPSPGGRGGRVVRLALPSWRASCLVRFDTPPHQPRRVRSR